MTLFHKRVTLQRYVSYQCVAIMRCITTMVCAKRINPSCDMVEKHVTKTETWMHGCKTIVLSRLLYHR